MIEITNPAEQDARIEAARIAVDAIFEEIGLDFPPRDSEVIRPEAKKEVPLKVDVLSAVGIKKMSGSNSHEAFAREMVAEAHREMPDVEIAIDQDSSSNLLLGF